MGLAASQARLLTITARLADNELRSQTINNAKMRLATQSSQASEDYVNALNNATMKFTNYALDGESQTQNLTFNALTAYSSYNNQYGLVNSSGQLLVSEEEALLFEKSNGDLNTYLQYHGLKYDTTYYDNVGAITNDGYIEPFNYISVEDMRTYFEQYNSYENSQEVEKYQNAYNTYISATSSLDNAAKVIMTSFLTANTNANIMSKNGNSYSMNYTAGDFAGMIEELKQAFNNPANTYSFYNEIIEDLNLDAPREDGDSFLADYNELLGSVNISNGTYFDTEEVSLVMTSENVYTLDDNIEITLDSITGLVSSFTVNEDGKNNQYSVTGTGVGLSLGMCIGNLTLTHEDENGTVDETTTYQVSYDKDGNIIVTGTSAIPVPTEPEESASLADEILNEIINSMISNFSINFAEALFSHPDAAANQAYIKNILGSDILSSPVNGTTKSLELYFEEYETAENTYFTTIFDPASIAQVQTDIANGSYVDADGNTIEISYRNLTDVDFVLRYMASQGLSPSETFLTVIKEFVVDQIIDEYGTPKYAWIDSTDPNTEGNADAKAQWYTNLFNRMLQGYKALENGLASSAEWIEYALETGIVTLEQVDASYNWQGLDYKACAKITEETDDAAVAKAEAEYTRAMNDIEAKDSIYDLELKNIDTEHSSLQTEYDSIKNVISKNIERTFNFYKNA